MKKSLAGIVGLFFYPTVDHVILGKIVSLGTLMYRVMNRNTLVLLMSALFLTACGQSGALHLPSDANADKRAKYLLYKDQKAGQITPHQEGDAPVSQQFAAPKTSNPTP